MFEILEKPPVSIQRKIAVRTQMGMNIINVENIAYLEGSGRYTIIHMKFGKTITVAKLLKLFEDCLPENFCRIHKSNIVNLNSIIEFKTYHHTKIMLENGTELEVSKRRKAELLRRLAGWMI